MARKTQTDASTPAATPPATAPLDFEAHVVSGDYAGARRLALAAVGSAETPEDIKARARATLSSINVEKQALAAMGGILVVLLVVFLMFIVDRNRALPGVVPDADVMKSMAPANTLPQPAAPQEAPNGTP